jgi:hypothetical protein
MGATNCSEISMNFVIVYFYVLFQPECSQKSATVIFLPIGDGAIDEYYKYISTLIFSALYGSVDEKSGKSKNILIFLIVQVSTNKCLYIRLLIIRVWINGETFGTPQLLTVASHND